MENINKTDIDENILNGAEMEIAFPKYSEIKSINQRTNIENGIIKIDLDVNIGE